MQQYKQYDLYQHNTMRLHCVADDVFVPESVDELMHLVQDYPAEYVYIAGGSNIILPLHLHHPVILLTSLPQDIHVGGNRVKSSSAVRIQQLIRTMQKNNLGGMEYLFSVPCTVGGAIYMNAGRGEVYNQSIADFVVSVECLDRNSGQVVRLSKSECEFTYRHSVFASGRYIILSVLLEMVHMSSDEVEAHIQERMQHAQMYLDAGKPSAGSIFKRCNPRIMHWLKGIRIGGACWSKKTDNWISNDKGASNKDVIMLIHIAQLLHKLLRKKCVREVLIIK